MVSVEYCQLLARYNRWMNERLYAVVDEFSKGELTRDRGAFFGSMHRTLNHILWGDRIWLSRFTNQVYTAPAFGAEMYADFAELTRERATTDTAILNWTGNLTPEWLAGSSKRARTPASPTCRSCPAPRSLSTTKIRRLVTRH